MTPPRRDVLEPFMCSESIMKHAFYNISPKPL